MDAELVTVPMDERWRLSAPALRAALQEHGPETFFAVVATSGTTNFGVVDDLAGVAEVCAEFGVWFHVDGAYGGAGLAAPSVRHLYDGIERADSFIVDPHKWLFAPFDCCALLYRDPALARAAHTQQASYLDILTEAAGVEPDRLLGGPDPPGPRACRCGSRWPPTGRRPTPTRSSGPCRWRAFAEEEIGRRALPRGAARARPVGRRLPPARAGRRPTTRRGRTRLLDEQVAFVVPTSHEGETRTRFAIVNPLTSEDDIRRCSTRWPERGPREVPCGVPVPAVTSGATGSAPAGRRPVQANDTPVICPYSGPRQAPGAGPSTPDRKRGPVNAHRSSTTSRAPPPRRWTRATGRSSPSSGSGGSTPAPRSRRSRSCST